MTEQERNPVDAEMQRLFDDADGELTVSAVLAEASKKTSPLHPFFEWNDKAAAAEHRKDQARKLIRRVRVIWEGERVRVYNVPSVRREQGTYRPAKVIVTTQTDYQRALGQALAKLRAAQEAVSELRAAAEGDEHPDSARIGVALEALSTAMAAMTMH